MLNPPFAAEMLAAEAEEEIALFMPAEWFGIIMFIVLMLLLLITVGFSSKSKSPAAREHEDH
ncbi:MULTISPECIES: hypothetical protein [Actinomycetes]|uniref:Uncharacterized protein n=2 Tax=Actinomycetes TaxID=1760 RepID=A0ABP6LNA3_9MICC